MSPVGPREPSIVWRFRSAAPLSGPPAVSAAGLVYMATVEGYVHALEPDGAFRWSYGLSGIPIGGPAVDGAGRVYVATSERRLYALRPDGRLGWLQRSPARFATPPIWVAPGFIYYAGRDRALYRVAAYNSTPTVSALVEPASTPLAALGEGLVAVGTEAPDAQVFQHSSLLARLTLESGLLQPLVGGKELWFAVTRSGLSAFDAASRAVLWSGPARRAAASADERTLVAELDRELVWLTPDTGVELQRAALPGEASAPPLVTNAGMAVVPMVSGELLVLEARGARRRAHVTLAHAPVWPPVWNELDARITAAAGAMVIGLDLSAWAQPGEEHEPPIDAPGAPAGASRDRYGVDRGGTAGSPAGSAG